MFKLKKCKIKGENREKKGIKENKHKFELFIKLLNK